MKARKLLIGSCLLISTGIVTSAYSMARKNPAERVEAEGPSLSFLEDEVGEVFARAILESKNNSGARGVVLLAKTDVGMRVVARVVGVPPGLKGFHAHENGDCSADDASSAGGHFNPGDGPHGHVGFHGTHAGDFGNIPIDEHGTGMLDVVLVDNMDLGLKSWEDFIGKSLVLHSGQDDLKSQPSGDSGDRIACGVIEKTQ